MISSKVDIGYV